MFIKKSIIVIILLFLFIGCESQTCPDSHLTISAPDLEMDNNGFYHITFLSDYIQTFTTLDAETNVWPQKIYWASNPNVIIAGYDTEMVNTTAYTDDQGIGHTVLSIWEQNIGDTITVYCTYNDQCNINHLDSLRVVVD